MLGRVKIPFEEIRKAILNMDDEKLNETLVKQLMQLIPTDDEIYSLNDYASRTKNFNPKDLPKAEQFFYEVRSKRLLCFKLGLNIILFRL